MFKLEKIEFQLTTSCNVRCIYCINDDGKKTKELPIEAIDSIIKFFKPQKVSFTGGDPLTCLEKLLDCIQIAKSYGCQVQINTNLELATYDLIDILVKAGLDILHVSFDTLLPSVYAKIRRSKSENLSHVISIMTYAASSTPLTVIPEIVPLRYNVRELPEIYNFLSLISVDGLEIQHLILGGRATSELVPLRLELVEQVLEVAKMISSDQPYLELWCFSGFEFPEICDLKNVRYAGCDCGRKIVYIGSDGKVYACNFFYQKKIGNIFEPKEKEPWQNLQSLWQDSSIFQGIRSGVFGDKLCSSH